MSVSTIHQLRLLPPLAIGRLGDSPDPMDNYTVTPDPDDPPPPEDPAAAAVTRTLTPALTLRVDETTGRIVDATTPDAVRFRDNQNRIKPVAPFLEVWAQFTADGLLEPLTKSHLEELQATVEWRVEVANLKAFRRTGDSGDQIHAIIDWFGDHQTKALRGAAPNFKAGKQIGFGRVQYLDPASPGFPEIRLRYTPAAGLVFGPRPPAQDPNVADDVYDGTRGKWLGHFDGRPNTPAPTAPGLIYYGHNEGQGENSLWVSEGYLDDACDGIVSVRVRFSGNELTAYARVSAGPPTFAPDTYHARTIADELEQIAHGPVATETTRSDAIDIIRRAGETVRMMHTAAMNDSFPDQPISNMSRHDSGRPYRRARERVFPGLSDQPDLMAIHGSVLERVVAGDFEGVVEILRPHDRVGDLSNSGRRRMPGMMRGSDGLHLALTRRQLDIVRKASQPADEGELPAGTGFAALAAAAEAALTPEQEMHLLIDHFFPRRQRHLGIEVDAERTLADLFSDKPALLDYLRSGQAKGPRSGAQEGQPLVVPGDPEHSALVLLIRTPSHPMHVPLTTITVGDTGRTGIEIIETWIGSL